MKKVRDVVSGGFVSQISSDVFCESLSFPVKLSILRFRMHDIQHKQWDEKHKSWSLYLLH